MRPRRPIVRRNNTAISVPLRSMPPRGVSPTLPRPRVLVTREYDEEEEINEDPDTEELDDDQEEEEQEEEEDQQEDLAQPHEEPQPIIAITSPIVSDSSDDGSGVESAAAATAEVPTATASIVVEELKDRAGKCVVCQQLPLESYICPNVHSVCGTCYMHLGDNSRKACPMCRVVNRFVPNYVYNHLVGRYWGREIKQQQLNAARATTTHDALLAEFRSILGPKIEVFCSPTQSTVARIFMLVFLKEYAATPGAKALPPASHMKEKLRAAFPDYSVLEYTAAQERLWWVYLGHLLTQDQILCVGCIKQHLYVVSRSNHNLLQ